MCRLGDFLNLLEIEMGQTLLDGSTTRRVDHHVSPSCAVEGLYNVSTCGAQKTLMATPKPYRHFALFNGYSRKSRLHNQSGQYLLIPKSNPELLPSPFVFSAMGGGGRPREDTLLVTQVATL